jgi:hypothetical protein
MHSRAVPRFYFTPRSCCDLARLSQRLFSLPAVVVVLLDPPDADLVRTPFGLHNGAREKSTSQQERSA